MPPSAKRRLGRRVQSTAASCGALCICIVVITTITRTVQATTLGTKNTTRRVLLSPANFPLRFEPNVGQAAASVRYLARGNGYAIALSERGATLDLGAEHRPLATRSGYVGPHSRTASVDLRFVHSNCHPRLEPEHRDASVSNYLLGNDPSRWHRQVPNYSAVRYQGIYPGIDWVVYGRAGTLEYDLIVAPGADPRRIALAISGSDRWSIDAQGDLLIDAGGRVVRQRQPVAYQTTASGSRTDVEAHYRLDHRQVRIALGPYDRRRPLVIDPALAFSTYLGGSAGEYATAVAVDAEGNVYVTGDTWSTDFPTLNPLQPTNKGDNIFIAKLNAAGTGLIYSTYLGGSSTDLAFGIAVDSAGDVYVAGSTSSSDFPVRNAFQGTYKGIGTSSNGFITKIDPTGGMLVYSTYLGGSAIDTLHGLAIDGMGSAYVVGETSSPDFPIANALQSTLKGRINAFISKLSIDGTSLVYSTYLGGTGADQATAIALDSSENVYVTGTTNSLDFPTVNPFQSANHVSINGNSTPTGFVSKLNAAGGALMYSSYLGGSGFELVRGIAVDNQGNAYIVGQTGSTDFPTVNAFQSTNNATTRLGGGTAFITKINSTGDALMYSTYLGGSGGGNGLIGDDAQAIAVNSSGDVFVGGVTASTDFPTVNPVQSTNKASAIGASNAFVSELNPAGNALLFSTYLGGSGSLGNTSIHTTIPFGDEAWGIALDAADNIYVVGQSGSGDFPTVNAYQTKNKTATQYGTVQTAFVAKFGTEVNLPLPTVGGGPSGGGGSLDWDALLGLTLIWLSRRFWDRYNIGK